jgi:hypothetical protein
MAYLETKKRNHGLIIGSRALGATRAAGHGPTPRVAHKTDYPMVAAFELARGFDADDAVRLDDVWLLYHADDGGVAAQHTLQRPSVSFTSSMARERCQRRRRPSRWS